MTPAKFGQTRVTLTFMLELTAALYDNGYQYMLDPDHAPDHPDDPDVSPQGAVAQSDPYYNGSSRVRQSYAFEFGYVKR